jgi:hypothetical protein
MSWQSAPCGRQKRQSHLGAVRELGAGEHGRQASRGVGAQPSAQRGAAAGRRGGRSVHRGDSGDATRGSTGEAGGALS